MRRQGVDRREIQCIVKMNDKRELGEDIRAPKTAMSRVGKKNEGTSDQRGTTTLKSYETRSIWEEELAGTHTQSGR